MSVGEIAAKPLFWMTFNAVPGLAPATWWNCESQVRDAVFGDVALGIAPGAALGTKGTRARMPSASNREAPGCVAAAAGTALKRQLPIEAKPSARTTHARFPIQRDYVIRLADRQGTNGPHPLPSPAFAGEGICWVGEFLGSG
jgi:hypothetical protein